MQREKHRCFCLLGRRNIPPITHARLLQARYVPNAQPRVAQPQEDKGFHLSLSVPRAGQDRD